MLQQATCAETQGADTFHLHASTPSVRRGLPPKQRLTHTKSRLVEGSRERLGGEPQPAGLPGPVRVMATRDLAVGWMPE